jgi:hypothetical protein
MGGVAAGGSRSDSEVPARRVFSRAVEATIWGMPVVSMAAIRRSLKRDLDAEFGDVVYVSDVMLPRHEFLTANHETPYVVICFDLASGPMVLDVPAASPSAVLFGSAIDSWEVPLVDVGATGDDAGKGGRYLFLPPDASEESLDGFIVVSSPTRYVHVALRPIAVGAGTRDDAVAYSQQLRTYPLADATSPRRNRYIDAFPLTWQTLPIFDLDFLRLLAEVIDDEPAQDKDAVMLGALASIGIAKGVAFEPDPERADLLAAAVVEGAAFMNDYFMNRAFVPHWPDSQWLATNPADNHGFSFHGDGVLDYDRRAGGFGFWATFAPKRLADPSKLPASYYLKAFRDGDGDLFTGEAMYRLRVPADTPAHDFWSIVAYEVGTNAFIHNPDDRVAVSSYDKGTLTINDDGSVDVYIGPAAPDGLASNWIPTAGRDFWLIMRFYGPDLPLFDGSWSVGPVDKI